MGRHCGTTRIALALMGFLCAGAVKGAEGVNVVHFQGFAAAKDSQNAPSGWTTWSPRPEIAPRFDLDRSGGRMGQGALAIAGGSNPAAVGAWRHRAAGIAGGRTYRFTARYRTKGIAQERRSVSARLDWLDENGARARPPDYAVDAGRDGDWTRVEYVATAPRDARGVVIELGLAWAPQGTVWWDEVTLREEASPRERVVRAMTVYHRPQGTKSSQESVEQFCRLVEAAAAQKPDVVCLPEGITVVGTGKSYAEVAEPVSGPTVRRLGEVAKALRCYVVAGIIERADATLYNTAVLIGRDGKLVGTYRKTHLPREEVEGGLTPGDSYPVFKTDFGTVGLLVCWDVQFPEPARALALKGAELILLPIWGGSETLARARAIENALFLVTSSYDMKTLIIDPAGETLAEASKETPVIVAELNLDRPLVQPWIGDMRSRTWKERRPDIPLPEAARR